MKDLRADQIRNVGIFGDGGAGKTALAEAMLYTAGAIDRLGNAADGNTAMDFEPEETKHQFSTSASLHHLNWRKTRVNLIDTPGGPNFLGDSFPALRAVDAAIFAVDGIDGVRVVGERLWARARELGVPRTLVVTKIDRERADFRGVLEDANKVLEGTFAVVTLPLRGASGASGAIDLLGRRALLYPDDGSGKPTESEIPAGMKAEVDAARESLIAAVAEVDDALTEKYLERGTLDDEEIRAALRQGLRAGAIIPVFCTALNVNHGVGPLLDVVVDCFPSPVDRPPVEATDAKTGEAVRLPADPAGPFAALVFKTVADPYAGQLTIFRVFSGTVTSDSNILNAGQDMKEHVGSLLQIEGKKQSQIPEASAGDIVAVAKLKHTHTGDTLSGAQRLQFAPFSLPAAAISFAIKAKQKGEEDKISQGLHRLMAEDPALRLGRDEATGDILLSTLGQMHAEVTIEKLARKFGVAAELHEPRVPYRETIKRKSTAQGKYKKQTGGRGQYGDCHITLEPNPGEGFEFVDAIVGGVIPRQYIPAVEKGVIEAMDRGVLAGYPVVDVKLTLFDGSYHDVDSSEMAFKVAGSMAFKKAAEQAGLCLLEPVMAMEISVPNDCLGDVIGDLNARRGRVLGMEVKGAHEVIKAKVPMAEVLKYAPELRSITSGRGSFTMEFDHYAEVPAHAAQRIIAAARRPEGE